MNRFCSNCGNRIIEGSMFCDKCGTKIDDIDNNVHSFNNSHQILKEENNGLKIASLVLGIISLVLALFLNVLIIPLAIIGLVLGIIYTSKSKKFCVGIVLNILGIIIPIIICIFLITVFTNINSSLENMWDEEYGSYKDYDNYYNEDNDYYNEDNDYYNEDNIIPEEDQEENSSSSQNTEDSYFKMTNVNEIKNFIINNETFILVITQTGCGHCIKYKPKVENVANKYKYNIYYIEYDLLNSDEKRTLSNYISFDGTPTTEFFNGGVENKDIRIVGNVVTEEEFEQILKNNEYIK